eukprot:m.240750 g.240750  ORF g.240750 m.240750 type:complete len:58 (+) comp40196_c1_seq43:3339-3512(+)
MSYRISNFHLNCLRRNREENRWEFKFKEIVKSKVSKCYFSGQASYHFDFDFKAAFAL